VLYTAANRTQDAGLLDTTSSDDDVMAKETFDEVSHTQGDLRSISTFRAPAAEIWPITVTGEKVPPPIFQFASPSEIP
jgi:hypothetical protein